MDPKNVVIYSDTKINYSKIFANQLTVLHNTPKGKPDYVLFELLESTPVFTGRQEQLAKIQSHLKTKNKCIITGLGGLGKSELIRQYAWKNIDHYTKNIIWLNAETEMHLSRAIYNVAAELNIATATATQPRSLFQIMQDIYGYFSNEMALFIFDNVQSLQDINSYFPVPASEHKNIHVLLSSQNIEWGNIENISLDVFSTQEACEFIKKYFKHYSVNVPDEDKIIVDMGKTLQFHPLALQQAVAYITDQIMYNDKEYCVNSYIDEFKKEELLLDHKFDDKNAAFPGYSETNYDKTIFITVQLMMKNIEILGMFEAKDILYRVAYFSADYIDQQVFLPIVDKYDDKNAKLNAAVREIIRYSLMTKRCDEYLFIHRLVQKVLRYRVKSEGQEEQILTDSLNLIGDDCENNDTHLASVLNYINSNENIYLNYYTNRCNNRKDFLYFVARNNFFDVFKSLLNKDELNDFLKDDLAIAVAFSQNVEMMKFIMKKGYKIDTKNKYGITALRTASLLNSKELMTFLMQELSSVHLNDIDDNGKTPIYFAVFNGNENLVKDLLKKGANVNAGKNYLLTLALLYKHYNIARILVNAGISIESQVNIDNLKIILSKCTPLSNDINLEEISVVNLINHLIDLLEKGKLDEKYYFACLKENSISNNEASSSSNEPFNKNLLKLHLQNDESRNNNFIAFAVNGNRVAVEEYLKLDNIEVDYADNRGCTALYYAALEGHLDIVKLLISKKANINQVNKYGHTILHAASEQGHENIVEYLVERGVKITIFDVFKLSAACVALINDHFNVFNFLVSSGFDVQKLSFQAIHEIINAGKLESVQKLLDAGFNIDNSDTRGFNMVHMAVCANRKAILRELIKRGANLNSITTESNTAITLAGDKGNFDMIRILLDNGAIPRTDKGKLFALTLAVTDNNATIVETVLNDGIDIKMFRNHIKEKKLMSILVQKGSIEILKLFVQFDSSCLQAKLNCKYTLVHIAAQYGYLEILKFLVSKGMSIEDETEANYTPLHIALFSNQTEIAEYLINIGANINSSHLKGINALALAVIKNNEKIIKILVDRQVRVNEVDENEDSALHLACSLGLLNIVRILCKAKDIDLNKPNGDGFTPLGLAANLGHVEVVKYLVEQGASINIPASNETNPPPSTSATVEHHDHAI